VRLHRAIALRYTERTRAALDALDETTDDLESHHLFYTTRAELLRAIGGAQAVTTADKRALA
jgi:predicted RNA polymerase sigma factor